MRTDGKHLFVEKFGQLINFSVRARLALTLGPGGERLFGRFWRPVPPRPRRPHRDPGRLQVGARRLPADPGRLLDAPKRPPQLPKRKYLPSFRVAQDVGHARPGTTSPAPASTSRPSASLAGYDPLTFGRFFPLSEAHSCANAFGPSTTRPFCSEGCVTGSAADIASLNELIDAEPGSCLWISP
jgi:hypothetical protein